MTDIQKLKALAQKQINPANWFKPGEKVEGLESKDLEFIAAANPALVLELITEIERLVPFEEAYATACNVRNRLIKENDQLDRLVVANKAISDSFRDERDQLKAENEALRKDAERWQFIRDEWPRVKLHYNGEWFNSEFLERKIDTAMSKDASHD